MLLTVGDAHRVALSPNPRKPRPKSPASANCLASLTIPNRNPSPAKFNPPFRTNKKRDTQRIDGSAFDPLGFGTAASSGLTAAWEAIAAALSSQTFESTSGTRKEKASARGMAGFKHISAFLYFAAAIEDSSIDMGDFFKGPLPGKFLKLLGYLAVSRLGIYVPLGGVNREAFVGNLDQNSLLSTLDSFSGGGIGRLGICSLGIVPFINAQIVFQLLTQIYPKLQELQKREGEAGRKKILQYTRYASVGFAIVQAIGQVLYLRPYVNDFSTEWVLSSVTLLTLGSVFTTYIGERISDLKLGNGTSLLIFTSIISYLPASFGRTAVQAFQDGNYVGLATIVVSFFLLVLGIVYVQDFNNIATSFVRVGSLIYHVVMCASTKICRKLSGKSHLTMLPDTVVEAAGFKNQPIFLSSAGVMPIIFSTSSLALPGTLARFTGLASLKKAAIALNPGGSLYLPTNILLIAFFNYYYTFLQLDPDDVSEQLKRQGASIPLIRPGKSTAVYIKTVSHLFKESGGLVTIYSTVLSRISVLGSAFLAVLAAGPAVVEQTTHLTAFRGFAGTSILILVGCATDTARKVQAEIISQKYKNIEFYDTDKYGL
ncbi:protein kinase-like protein scy1 [Asimina triloba]